MGLDVSVVIPTFNRRQRLIACLERLALQTIEPGRFEVIVVSDGSTDGTLETVAALRTPFALAVIEAPHGGPGAARNQGVARARAPWIAFTDDDVEVEPQWLDAGLAHFARPEIGGVEGRTMGVLGAESLYRGNVSNLTGGLYPTCNIFYRKEVLERVGGFDPGFGQAREDSDLAYRVLDLGLAIPFEPRAQASHRSHKSSVWLPLSHARGLMDTVRLGRKHPGREPLRALVYRSDLAKVGLALFALAALAAGRSGLAALGGLAFFALVGRIMRRELVIGRALRPDRLPALVLAYSLVPFFNLAYLLIGWVRARDATSRKISS